MKTVKSGIFKYLILPLALLVLIATLAAGLFIYFYPHDRILGTVVAKTEEALNRSVSIADFRYSFGGITLRNVIIRSERAAESPALVSAGSIDLRFSPWSLINRTLDISSIRIRKADLTIAFDDEGESTIGRLIKELSEGPPSSITTTVSFIRLEQCSLTLKNPPTILKPLRGTYQIDATVRFGESISIRDCRLRLPDGRGIAHPELDITRGDQPLAITGEARLENASLLWVYQWGTNLNLPYRVLNGTVTNLRITKDSVSGSVNSTSTLQGSPLILTAVGNCTVRIDRRTVALSTVRGSMGDSSFMIYGLGFTFDGDITNFKVTDIKASIPEVRVLLSFLPQPLFGYVAGELSFAKGIYNGRLSLTSVGYDPSYRIVSDLNGDIIVINNTYKNDQLKLKLLGNPCLVAISCTDPSMKNIFMQINAETFIFDQKKLPPVKSPGTGIPWIVSGTIAVKDLRYPPHNLSRVTVAYRLTGDTFGLERFSAMYADGQIGGTGVIKLASDPVKASLNLTLANLKMQSVLDHHEKLKNRIFGMANGTAKIDINLNDRLFETARGRFEFSITGGKLVDTGIQNGLGLLLSELKYKIKNLEFNRIYGNLDIRDTDFVVNNFIFNADNIRIKMNGTFNQKLVATPLNIQLEFNDYFIQDLPGVFALGMRKYYSAGWYSIPFIQQGDLMDSKHLKRVN